MTTVSGSVFMGALPIRRQRAAGAYELDPPPRDKWFPRREPGLHLFGIDRQRFTANHSPTVR